MEGLSEMKGEKELWERREREKQIKEIRNKVREWESMRQIL